MKRPPGQAARRLRTPLYRLLPTPGLGASCRPARRVLPRLELGYEQLPIQARTTRHGSATPRTASSAPSRCPLMAAVAAEQRKPVRSLSADG